MLRGVILSLLMAGAAMAETPDGRWQVTALAALALVEGDSVELSLLDGHLSGSAGCNRFMAGYDAGEGLSIGPVASTRMLCQGRVADLEAAVLGTLSGITDWRRVEGALELLSGETVALRAQPLP